MTSAGGIDGMAYLSTGPAVGVTVRVRAGRTYMLHPGSAVYFGFTDPYEDLSLDPDTPLPLLPSHRTLVARQLFVKITRAVAF